MAASPCPVLSRPRPRVLVAGVLPCQCQCHPSRRRHSPRHPSKAGQARWSACPLLRGGALLSRGISASPCPWRRAVVARGVRAAGFDGVGSGRGPTSGRRGVAWVAQPGLTLWLWPCSADGKVASGKGEKAGPFSGDRVAVDCRRISVCNRGVTNRRMTKSKTKTTSFFIDVRRCY